MFRDIFNKVRSSVTGRLILKSLAMCVLSLMVACAVPTGFAGSAKTRIYSYSNIFKSNVAPGWSRYNFSGDTYYYQYSGSESDVSIPSSVTVLNRGAIVSNKKVRVLRIPSTVTYIDAGAIYDLANLKYVIFYGDTEIAEDAFYGCDNIVNFVAARGTGADSYGKDHGIMVARTESTGFAKKTVYIKKGYTYAQPVCNLSEKVLSWSSSNPSVVSVDSNGKIKAIKPGNATITVNCDSKTFSYKVVVFDKKITKYLY